MRRVLVRAVLAALLATLLLPLPARAADSVSADMRSEIFLRPGAAVEDFASDAPENASVITSWRLSVSPAAPRPGDVVTLVHEPTSLSTTGAWKEDCLTPEDQRSWWNYLWVDWSAPESEPAEYWPLPQVWLGPSEDAYFDGVGTWVPATVIGQERVDFGDDFYTPRFTVRFTWPEWASRNGWDRVSYKPARWDGLGCGPDDESEATEDAFFSGGQLRTVTTGALPVVTPLPGLAPTTDEIDWSVQKLLLSAAATPVLLLVAGFPAEIFNKTLENNAHRWRRRRTPRLRGAARTVLVWGVFALLVAGTSVLLGNTTGSGGPSLSAPSTAVAVIAVGLVYAQSSRMVRRVWGEPLPPLRISPAGVVVAAVSLAASILARFFPPYLYGLFLGESRDPDGDGDRGRAALAVAVSALSLFAAGLLSWVLYSGVLRERPELAVSAGPAVDGLSTFFTTSLQSLVVALVPLVFMDGRALFVRSRLLWLALFTPPTWLYLHVMVFGAPEWWGGPSEIVESTALFLGFGIFSMLFWATFAVLGRLERARTPAVELIDLTVHDDAPPREDEGLAVWEDEGGALVPTEEDDLSRPAG